MAWATGCSGLTRTQAALMPSGGGPDSSTLAGASLCGLTKEWLRKKQFLSNFQLKNYDLIRNLVLQMALDISDRSSH
jgi:hypothetical protein